MSMEDPFFVVKGEVQKAVNTAQGLFQRWTELLQDPSIATREEIDWTTNELRNNLRSIEWDLEDLDETINILSANPRKFNLDATELGIRKAFITSTRQVVREMKDQMSNSSMQALAERKNRQALLGESGSQSWSAGPDKYSRLDRELQLANSHFIEEQQAQQQLIVEQQDEQLELVSGSIGVLKNMSQRIGGELEEQAVMLDDFSHELDSTQSRLDNVMKKLAKVSHMTSDAFLFMLLLPRWENPPLDSRREALQPPALLQFLRLPAEQKLSRCHKTLATVCGFPPTPTKHLPAASSFPNPTCPRAAGTGQAR
ncbi:syntaxin-6 isoform X1 [Strix uralensis]|uniref:syntaxin-6 isoform X1 n=2 Tax=Strix uralensis TaxID=36305 RepID=UPI003DA795F2